MYLGEEIGEGLEIYPPFTVDNPDGLVEYRTISDEEIINFTHLDRGFDPGYSHAACYAEVYYDFEKAWVYIIDEVYLYGANNQILYLKIKEKAGTFYIAADNEDPRLINEFNLYGLNMGKTIKGKDSKDHGIKWLQDRGKIIIDKKRTPNIANDFQNYEFKKNKEGKIIYDYPEEPDGCLTAETKVLTNKGYVKIIDLVNTKGKLLSLNTETNTIEEQNYFDCRKTGTNRKVYEVTTKSGKTFKCTSNHPILTNKGYKQLKDLQIGDKIIDITDCLVFVEINLKQIKIDQEKHVDEVVRIKECGNEDVYNLEVEKNHNFFINGGLCVHNSAAVRYALEKYILDNKIKFGVKR